MLELDAQLSTLGNATCLAEVALRVSPTISWMPQAIQNILGSKVTLGQATREAAAKAAERPGHVDDQRLIQIRNLASHVRARSPAQSIKSARFA